MAVAMMPGVDQLDALIGLLPPGTVSTHPGEVAMRTHDRWSLAMLREVRGDRVPPPAAVVFPTSTEHVATTLAWATATGTAVVPRGGASGLSGGAEALKRSVVLDLSRMDRVLGIDTVSQTVTAEAGIRGGALEEAVGRTGFTTGHYPASLEISSLGGWIASSGTGVAATGYGTVADRVLGLTVVLGDGSVVELPAVPRSGAGPDLRRLFVGSEGCLGVLTEATLGLARLPSEMAWELFRPRSFESGAGLAREMIQRGYRPLVLRLMDADDAGSMFAAVGLSGTALVIGFDAAAPGLRSARYDVGRLAKEFGATALGPDLALHWWEHRTDVVGWQEGAMGEDRALGPGVMVDSLDTSGVWRHIPRLHEELRGVVLDRAESVGCTLSDASVCGAALQFSFVLRGEDDRQVERLYRDLWPEALAACRRAGGTVAHHLGVGLLRAPFLELELGRSGVSALAAIKRALDPGGVMNPGKLIPVGE